MHSKDIAELNRIATNEYEEDMEIGRKLRIIRVVKQVVQDEIDTLNFDVILNFMKSVNWIWAHTIAGRDMVPTKEDLIKHIHNDMDHALYKMIELGENKYHVTSGGLDIEIVCGNLSYADKGNTRCSIGFDIAHFVEE